jgi:hypothetical protein
MQKVIGALEDWRQANAKAREAEAKLSAAVQREMQGGPLVDQSLIDEVSRLRACASEKLSTAMELMAHPEATRL